MLNQSYSDWLSGQTFTYWIETSYIFWNIHIIQMLYECGHTNFHFFYLKHTHHRLFPSLLVFALNIYTQIHESVQQTQFICLPTKTFLSRFFLRSASRNRFTLITFTRGRLWKSKCSPQKHMSPFCLDDVRAYSVLSRHKSQKYL